MRRLFLLILLFPIFSWGQAYQSGSDWLYGPGQDWVYEPGKGFTFELGGGWTEVTLQNPGAGLAKSTGYMGQFTIYHPFSMAPYFDIGPRLTLRYSDTDNLANNSILEESSGFFGVGPGLEMRFYRFVLGAEIYFDKASLKTTGSLNNSVDVTFRSFHYYMGIDIPIKPFQVRVLWKRGNGTLEKDKTGLSQDSDFNETTWYIGLRYSTDFTWTHLKQSLL